MRDVFHEVAFSFFWLEFILQLVIFAPVRDRICMNVFVLSVYRCI